jgi:hypothetical protein
VVSGPGALSRWLILSGIVAVASIELLPRPRSLEPFRVGAAVPTVEAHGSTSTVTTVRVPPLTSANQVTLSLRASSARV